MAATDYLQISPGTMNVYFDEDTNMISVFSNKTDWVTSSNQPWLTTVDNTVKGYFYIVTQHNTGTGLRSATVTVSQPGLSPVYLYVNQFDAVGIEDKTEETSLMVYPNPFNDFVYISTKGYRSSKMFISLYNILGEEVLQTEKSLVYGENNDIYLDLNKALLPGFYVMKINMEGFSQTIKLIKK